MPMSRHRSARPCSRCSRPPRSITANSVPGSSARNRPGACRSLLRRRRGAPAAAGADPSPPGGQAPRPCPAPRGS
ncbi:MAG: hypothetical protein MZV64_42845 [Ignavibacteriales bacterium]|nr:hypothetical protein [Ignavibacteriales bacterium]